MWVIFAAVGLINFSFLHTYSLNNSLNVDMFPVQVLIIGYDISQCIEVITFFDGYVWDIVKLAHVASIE